MFVKFCQAAVRWLAVLICVISLGSLFPRVSVAEEATGGCEVVSFDAFEESQAVLTPGGEYKVIARRQCASLTIRNTSGSPRTAEDFLVIAVFGKGNISEGGLDLAGSDAKKRIPVGETYSGTACLDDGSPILILNCALK